jgi:hypothetical protein
MTPCGSLEESYNIIKRKKASTIKPQRIEDLRERFLLFLRKRKKTVIN